MVKRPIAMSNDVKIINNIIKLRLRTSNIKLNKVKSNSYNWKILLIVNSIIILCSSSYELIEMEPERLIHCNINRKARS